MNKGDFMFAVDIKHHFEGFIHADTLIEAKEQIQGTEYRVHALYNIK